MRKTLRAGRIPGQVEIENDMPIDPPVLRRSVAAFVDFLGYSDSIIKSFKAGKAQQELERLHHAIQQAYADLKARASRTNYRGEVDFQIRTFTDNLIIGCPIEEHGYPRDTIASVVFYIAFLQAELIRQGYFIRGAIAVGDLYIDEDIVFGPALMDAYLAESKAAIFPRVIFHETAEVAFKDDGDWIRAHTLLKDSDNRVFIDYLDATVMIAYPDDRPFTEFSDGHKASLIEKLKEFREVPYIRAKYEWAANYHNWFCSRHPEVFSEADMIPMDLLLPAPEPWTAKTAGVG